VNKGAAAADYAHPGAVSNCSISTPKRALARARMHRTTQAQPLRDVSGGAPESMSRRTILWSVVNASNFVVTCSMEEQPSGEIRLTVELENNELISEVHYTPAEALSRARELRRKINT
jgi:hypothetical protein